jgi:hypothetical protein
MDIKETKELLVAISGLSVSIAEKAKDGLSLTEIMAVLSENVENVITAISGISEVPAEMKDLSKEEIVELASMGALMVFDIVEAIKK